MNSPADASTNTLDGGAGNIATQNGLPRQRTSKKPVFAKHSISMKPPNPIASLFGQGKARSALQEGLNYQEGGLSEMEKSKEILDGSVLEELLDLHAESEKLRISLVDSLWPKPSRCREYKHQARTFRENVQRSSRLARELRLSQEVLLRPPSTREEAMAESGEVFSNVYQTATEMSSFSSDYFRYSSQGLDPSYDD